MKVTLLVDNYTMINKDYKAEPAFSLYLETEGKKILFDTGYSDIFIKNAEKAKVDLTDIDYIVLSHGHYDHTIGLVHYIKYLDEKKLEGAQIKRSKLIMHPYATIPKLDKNKENWGMAQTKEELENYFDVITTKKPYKITDNLIFLGEIERKSKFEKFQMTMTINLNGVDVEDELLDDTAMALKTKDGVFVITGCSHSGISNICEATKKICNDERIIGLIGGLHLKKPTQEQLDRTIEYLKTLKLKKIYACHCTGLVAKIAIANEIGIEEVGSGYTLNL